MLANMAASLFLEESLTTTVTRAKELRRVAEKLITRAKGDSLNDRRVIRARLGHKEASIKLFEDLAKRYAHRPGGYTRIIKTGNRCGDGSPMAIIELVD
jgi:large subunit ribosomal protein L17